MNEIHIIGGKLTLRPKQIIISGGTFDPDGQPPDGIILELTDDLIINADINCGTFDPPTQPSTTPCEGGRRRQQRITAAEAEILVRDWLHRHAARDPFGVSIRQVAAAVGVAVGTVAKTAAWKAFAARRKALRPPTAREVPLSDGMLSVLPDDRQRELEALIAEQAADMRRDRRRS